MTLLSIDASREFGQLAASAYVLDDTVIGEAEDGETAIGTVTRVDLERNEVTVKWAGETYTGSCIGHICDPAWLRLWPASAQAARIAGGAS